MLGECSCSDPGVDCNWVSGESRIKTLYCTLHTGKNA